MKHDMAWDPVADLIESLQSMRSTFLRAFSRLSPKEWPVLLRRFFLMRHLLNKGEGK